MQENKVGLLKEMNRNNKLINKARKKASKVYCVLKSHT